MWVFKTEAFQILQYYFGEKPKVGRVGKKRRKAPFES